jgi:hypothetical protein
MSSRPSHFLRSGPAGRRAEIAWWAVLSVALVATSGLFTALFVVGVMAGSGWPELLFCFGVTIFTAWLSLGAQAYLRWMIRTRLQPGGTHRMRRTRRR